MAKSLRFLSLLPLWLALVLAAARGADKAEGRALVIAPPPPRPLSVKVARGHIVEIPLRIYGRQNETLRYVIKTQPAFGKLSAPRAVQNEVSTVTYEPPDDLKVTADRFTYAVRSIAGVSAPVEVTIAITDEPSSLAIPETLAFAEILAGTTSAQEFEVANRGGGLALGEVQVDPPWRVEGRTQYRLGTGDYVYFKVVFAPNEGGSFRGEMRFTSDREHTTALLGEATAPIAAEPAKITLQPEPDSAARSGSFELVNHTTEERTFQLQAGPRLHVEPDVTVPAQGRATVAVRTEPSEIADFATTVNVEAPGFALRVPVTVPRAGALLRVTQAKLDFGRVDPKRPPQLPLEIENAGGSGAGVRGEISAPFQLTEPAFDLAPGEKKQLALTLQPATPGSYRTWLKFRAGDAAAEIEVQAEVTRAGGAPAANSRPRRGNDPASSAERDPEDLPEWMPDLNIAKGIRVFEVQPTAAKLEWPAELSDAARFRFERLILMRDTSGAVRKAWIDIPKVVTTRDGLRCLASVVGLHPEQSQTIRIVPLDAAGKAGKALFVLDFVTPPLPQRLPRFGLVPVLLAGLAGCVGFMAWKHLRRPLTETTTGF